KTNGTVVRFTSIACDTLSQRGVRQQIAGGFEPRALIRCHAMPHRSRLLVTAAMILMATGFAVPVLTRQTVFDRTRDLPGYYQYSRMQEALREPAVVSGALSVSWDADSRSFTFASGGRRMRFSLDTRVIQQDSSSATSNAARSGGAGRS